MITASSLSRLMNCPGSAVLPRAENVSVWADAGHDEHEELADQLLTGTLPENIARHMPPGAKSEIALAFCVATGVGRIIGENLGRAYGTLGPFEICGACDVGGVEDDAVVVVDFKTGFNAVESATTNPQLAFYALALARAMNKTRAIVRIIYTKTGRCDDAELDALDLAAFAESLRNLHRRVAAAQATRTSGTTVDTREGSWCRHCSSKPFCASKNGLLVQVAEKGLAVIGDTTMTTERASSAYQQIVRIEQLAKDARARLNAFVDEHGPIAVADGKMYGRYHRPGNKRLSGDVAVQAIAEIVGEQAKEFEAIAIERSTSQAAIERAAKQFAPKRGAAKMKAQIVARIDELGGVTHGSDSYPYGEYPAGAESATPKAEIDLDAINRQLESA